MTFTLPELISPGYLDEQRKLHASPRGYGQRGDKWSDGVRRLVVKYDASSVLDYGCGAGSLKKALQPMLPPTVRVSEYDPAIRGKDGTPSFADLVVVTDVLEHIEPERLDLVLAHLKLLARKAIFAVIATRPAKKTLSDGSNAHLIIEPPDWWKARLKAAGFTTHLGPRSPLKVPSNEFVVVLTC